MDVFSFDELNGRYPLNMVERIEASFSSRPSGQKISGLSMGARSFLTWLSHQKGREVDIVKRLFAGTSDIPVEEIRTPLHVLAKRWVKSLKQETDLTNATVTHYARRFVSCLRNLHTDHPDLFPKIPNGFLRQKEVKHGTHQSLGQLDWPELGNLTGAARERKALNILRAVALERFAELETMFWFGQTLLAVNARPPAKVDSKAWHAIRNRLLHAAKTDSKVNPRFSEQGVPFQSLSDPAIWRSAGLNVDVTRRGPLARRGVSKLMDFCTTPTLELCHLVAVIYCCATAWNKQPIFDIASNPYIFAKADKKGVVTSSFFSEIKKRAGHEMSAFLDSGKSITPSRLDNLMAIIREVELEFPQFGFGAFEELAADDAALDVLERYQRIIAAVETDGLPQAFKARLFFYRANGKFRLAAECKKPLSYLKLFDLKGLDYPAIRKTVLHLKLRSVGSIAALSVVASHNDSSVLMPHYINTDDDQNQYSEKIRLVQKNIQALLIGKNKKLILRLNISQDDFEYYTTISKISGIGAAMLPMEIEQWVGKPTYEFKPSPSYFLTIYLISFALTKLRLDGLNPARWQVQGRELLILARGIKRALIESGLGTALRQYSTRGFAGLKDGSLALPVLLEL